MVMTDPDATNAGTAQSRAGDGRLPYLVHAQRYYCNDLPPADLCLKPTD